MEGRDSMIIYRSFYEAIKELPLEDQALVWNAIYEYGLNFSDPELSGLPKTIFTLIKPQLDANIKRYENGKKPKTNQTISKPEAKDKQTGSKTLTNVNDNVNVNNNDNQKAFRVDANINIKEYRKYLFDLVKEKEISRDELFMNNKIDVSKRNELWEGFIKNSIIHVPRINNDEHAWNTFKKYIHDTKSEWQIKSKSNFEGF